MSVELVGFLDRIRIEVTSGERVRWDGVDQSLRNPYGEGPFDHIVKIIIPTKKQRTHEDAEFTFSFGCHGYPTPDFVYGCLREAIAHEVAECFLFNGKPLKDAHGPRFQLFEPCALRFDMLQPWPKGKL